MLKVQCADLGIPCRGTVKARTQDELLQKVAEHAAGKHGVPELNQTLVNYTLSKVEGTPEGEEEGGRG